MTRLYVAGPMSGMPDFNFPAFFAAADTLRALSYDVENPADNDGPTLEIALANAKASVAAQGGEGASWASYLKRDMVRIFGCDGVCVLPGWQKSRGANLEVDVATRLGMPIYCLQYVASRPPTELTAHYALVPRVRTIGLSGYARSGKDTVGRILVEQHGYVRASFAQALKALSLTIDPITHRAGTDAIRLAQLIDGIGWEEAKDGYPEVRRILQRLGTGVRDVVGENTWVDLAMRGLPDGAKVVFTDCRFPNEAEAIKRAGGHVWRVTRHDCGPVNGHISETALDDFDFDDHIYNGSTLDDLAERVRMALLCQ